MNVLLILLLPLQSLAFIIGGCIGPKSVLEKYLTTDDRRELRRLVHTEFDGSNVEQILQKINTFVYSKITHEQWRSIVPHIKQYQEKRYDCSIYAQLLPTDIYRSLMQSVYRATETGASKFDIKRLVEDYLDRLNKAGKLHLKVSASAKTISEPKPHVLIERPIARPRISEPSPHFRSLGPFRPPTNENSQSRGPPAVVPRITPFITQPTFPLVEPFSSATAQRLRYKPSNRWSSSNYYSGSS